MTTVSYSLELEKTSVLLPKGAFPSLAATKTGFFLASSLVDGPQTAQAYGRLFDPHAAPYTSAFVISTNAGPINTAADAATLTNGTLVTVSDHHDPVNHNVIGVFAALNSQSGTVVKGNFEVSPGAPGAQTEPSVAALSDGGFVVTYTYRAGVSDHDIFAQRYDFNGNATGAEISVDESGALNTSASSVARLPGGGFVVAYSEVPTAGGNEHIVFRIFNNAGVGAPAFDVDTSGSSNRDPELLALKDGGFALAYESNGWNEATSEGDITLQIFNPDGTPRTNHLRVNASNLSADGGNTLGNQFDPTLAQLPNGDIVVGWVSSADGSDDNIKARAFSAKGHALTAVTSLTATADYVGLPSMAGLKHGVVAAAWFQQQTADSYDTVGRTMHLVRTSIGTKHGEKIKGDDLVDRMSGKGGDDKLFGGRGGDVLKGGAGADDMHAGKGDDRDVFVFTSKDDSGNGKESSWDHIFGFDPDSKHEAVSDKIDLSGLDGDKHAKHDQHFRFVDHFEKAGKGQPDGEVTVHDDGKDVKVLVDVNGDKDTDMVILVVHVHDLHKGDFIL